MATRDGAGFLTIVDWKKDLIVSRGFNVFPRAVEDVLSSAPGVAMCVVIRIPDDHWGEAVTAVVVRKSGADVTAQALMALVREHKGPVYAPESVDFADARPLTALGKADKPALRAQYWGGQARLVPSALGRVSQRHGADGLQRPFVPRSRFRQPVSLGVRHEFTGVERRLSHDEVADAPRAGRLAAHSGPAL